MMFEEGGKATKTVQYAFAVIQSVYWQDQFMLAEKFPGTFNSLVHFFIFRGLMIRFIVDSHW